MASLIKPDKEDAKEKSMHRKKTAKAKEYGYDELTAKNMGQAIACLEKVKDAVGLVSKKVKGSQSIHKKERLGKTKGY